MDFQNQRESRKRVDPDELVHLCNVGEETFSAPLRKSVPANKRGEDSKAKGA